MSHIVSSPYCIIRKFCYVVLLLQLVTISLWLVFLALDRASNIWDLAMNVRALSPAKDTLPLTICSKSIQICGFGTGSYPQGTSQTQKLKKKKKKEKKQNKEWKSNHACHQTRGCLPPFPWLPSDIIHKLMRNFHGGTEENSPYLSLLSVYGKSSHTDKCDTGDRIHDM